METKAAALNSQLEYSAERQAYWDQMTSYVSRSRWLRRSYRNELTRVYRFLIPRGSRVLELGSGNGDLLAAVQPCYGLGIDFSTNMTALARTSHPDLDFRQEDAHTFDVDGQFDFVICSDLLNDVWDVQQVLERILAHTHQGSRVIVNLYSRLWEWPRHVAENAGLIPKQLPQNWLTLQDVENIFYLANFEVIRHWQEVLCPVEIPILATVLNRYAAKLPGIRALDLTNFLIARPRPTEKSEEPVVSVVVPARNEAGNIEQIFERVPDMGGGTELIFVEGNSSDNTYEAIEAAMKRHPERRSRLFKQTGKGKGDAVRLGFQNATGELLMILDADVTVPPEDLSRFYEAWRSGKGEFVNGVRLVYPMEEEAMRFANLLGNKFFSLAFSWLLSQSVKDTLCGTKVLSKTHYEVIAANRGYFGQLDPFGDFDLLFGAAKLNLKIVDLPIRYRERTYGTTNIQRWRHGVLLFRMLWLATRRLKFV